MKREVREQRLHDLVERFLAHLAQSAEPCSVERSLELIAHSPESPIAQAVAGQLPRLKAAQVEVRTIFAFTDPEPLLARWLAEANWVRSVKDARLLEVHEQLVLGKSRCWTGDAMRRGSTKTDLFESLNEGSQEAAKLGRTSFRELARFANVIRPRRVTASLNAIVKEQAVPARDAVDTVMPSSEPTANVRLLTTRH